MKAHTYLRGIMACAAVIIGFSNVVAQDELPFEVDSDFFKLPAGWNFGQTPGAALLPNGNILIFTRTEHALLEFEPDGRFVRELAHGMFTGPHGLRVDRHGNIWTTDTVTHLVYKFDGNGRKLLVLGVKGQAGFEIVPGENKGLHAHLFNKPTDVAFDAQDNIYVSDGYGNSRVVKFDADGNYLMAWGEHGTEPGQFDLPHSIYVDPDQRVWVADRDNERLQIFDTDGNLLKVLTGLGWPWGLAAASDGNLWMADGTNNRIIKIDHDGNLLSRFGEPGRAKGKLGWVHYLVETSDGSLIVGEIVSERPQRFVLP